MKVQPLPSCTIRSIQRQRLVMNQSLRPVSCTIFGLNSLSDSLFLVAFSANVSEKFHPVIKYYFLTSLCPWESDVTIRLVFNSSASKLFLVRCDQQTGSPHVLRYIAVFYNGCSQTEQPKIQTHFSFFNNDLLRIFWRRCRNTFNVCSYLQFWNNAY